MTPPRDGGRAEFGLGRPAEVLAAPVLRAAYGVDVCVMAGPDGHPVVVPLHASPTGSGTRVS